MGKDASALLRLWKEKRGEVDPPDLSGIKSLNPESQGNRISILLAFIFLIDSTPLRFFGLRGCVDGRVRGLFFGA